VIVATAVFAELYEIVFLAIELPLQSKAVATTVAIEFTDNVSELGAVLTVHAGTFGFRSRQLVAKVRASSEAIELKRRIGTKAIGAKTRMQVGPVGDEWKAALTGTHN